MSKTLLPELVRRLGLVVLLALLVVGAAGSLLTIARAVTVPEPNAPNSFTYITNYSPAPSVGSVLNTSGGSIAVVNINATTANPHWKAFVGNITGSLALLDSQNKTLYDWTVATVKGELYATRNSSLPVWPNITCANAGNVTFEEGLLSITSSEVDSINKTFNKTVHDSFYAGIVEIPANTCPSTALYVNSTSQASAFQEVLLHDGERIIYASLLENKTFGFNQLLLDYQMIVPETWLEGEQGNTAYYMYVELI